MQNLYDLTDRRKSHAILVACSNAEMRALLLFLLSNLSTKMRSFQDNDNFGWKKKTDQIM